MQNKQVFLSHFDMWGIFPVREIRGFPILLSRSGKNCQNLSRSGNKMIIFYIPQHIAWRINMYKRIAKTNAPGESLMNYLGFHLLDFF